MDINLLRKCMVGDDQQSKIIELFCDKFFISYVYEINDRIKKDVLTLNIFEILEKLDDAHYDLLISIIKCIRDEEGKQYLLEIIKPFKIK
ncbi:hypothetical protein [Halobacteriovorax sp. CON-3]|uniref:hypothetical protein n=1 Tax=Halobacteriovorax sp. CON-3 TaxID=3157710 RepID=UPI003722424E